jgi:hypothetical protein
MTLRIEIVADEGSPTIVLYGRLSATEVAVFETTAAEAGLPLRIDLGNLVAADAEGRLSLRRQRRSGACLVGASPYIGLLLEREDDAERVTAAREEDR